jgi:putative PIN family toxin of toxin-antitoxin system
MRIVVDTNVFISAILKEKSLAAMAVHLVEQRDTLLKSALTKNELFQVLDCPRISSLVAPEFRVWLRGLFDTAEMVAMSERVAICRDPKDDKFLELPATGRADLIISGDKDLLTLVAFRGIPIVTPAAFVETAIH